MQRRALAAFCGRAYERFHRPCFISPDPLEIVREFDDLADREIVGLLASTLALGRVGGILPAVRSVLERMARIDPSPAKALAEASEADVREVCEGFVYRFFDADQLAGLLVGIGRALSRYGSLERCVAAGACGGEDKLLGGLAGLVDTVTEGAGSRLDGSILLPRPDRGSACKRLLLFARWMVRCDEIDPGGWQAVGARELMMPVDTHVLRVARALGLTRRKVASIATSREITDALRAIAPSDPVRYDFALTRPGINPLLDEAGWLAADEYTRSV
ncbi:MAG: TIGR02757 family protein [Spirochaetota bacterium]